MTDVDGALKAKQMKTQIDEYLKVNGNILYFCVLYMLIMLLYLTGARPIKTPSKLSKFSGSLLFSIHQNAFLIIRME